MRRHSTFMRRKIPNAKLPLTGFVIFVIQRGGRTLLYGKFRRGNAFNGRTFSGTPADRSSISVGDEIIGVNDWVPESKTYEDIVEHVQEVHFIRILRVP